MDEIIFNVENLYKYFLVGKQNVEILKGINFQIKKGDFAIIFGPSGSGKSTLLHIILGLEEPSSGRVVFLNDDFYKGKDEDARAVIRKKHVGMVYQQPNWVKSLTVVENVAFPLVLLGKSKAECIELAWKELAKLQMQNWVGYKPTELSGGQQQKVAVARALITNPEVIIADEPTGNLDFESGQELMQLFTKLNEEGKTIMMVTHDLEYLKFAKTAIQFLDGKVVGVFSGAERDKIIGIKYKRGVDETQAQTPVETTTSPTPVSVANTQTQTSVETPPQTSQNTELKPLDQTLVQQPKVEESPKPKQLLFSGTKGDNKRSNLSKKDAKTNPDPS